MKTLHDLSQALASRQISSRELTLECLSRAAQGEGDKVFIELDPEGALAAAEASDLQREHGVHPSPYSGIPISVKDLFDVQGQFTRAGSKLLDKTAASKDAPAIANLRRAGFVLIGRTNMTEFAFSGLGLNPHYGTPANPWDRENRRIPGGSSSGAAVSVTDDMAFAAVGSDTGGSCRIPAALCGLYGYKPTQDTVSLKGVVPLSSSLDSVGAVAHSPRCLQVLHTIMSGGEPQEHVDFDQKNPRIAVPKNFFFDGIDRHVASDFERYVEQMREAGAYIEEIELEPLERLSAINAKGGFAAAEAYSWHQNLLNEFPDQYDPRVSSRIAKGEVQTAADYILLLNERNRFVSDMENALDKFDAFAFPTVPIVAPKISELEENEELYTRVNLLMLRNSSVVNFLNGCAINMPMQQEGDPPTGITLAGIRGTDAKIFEVSRLLSEGN